MEYVLLIYGDESAGADAQEQEAMFREYGRFTQELRESGAMVGGRPLEASATATTVRVRNGKRSVTDGPYAETKEQLGGFYIVEAAGLDEALEWAAKIPGARRGKIEVRPVLPIPEEAMQP
jgi:hypothetical protein